MAEGLLKIDILQGDKPNPPSRIKHTASRIWRRRQSKIQFSANQNVTPQIPGYHRRRRSRQLARLDRCHQ